MNGVCPLDLVPMATKNSLQKDALEEACQELPQHFNSQSEQWINTATDSTAQAKNVCKQQQEVTDGLLLFKIEKVHSSFKHVHYKENRSLACESHLLSTGNKVLEQRSFPSLQFSILDFLWLCFHCPHWKVLHLLKNIFCPTWFNRNHALRMEQQVRDGFVESSRRKMWGMIGFSF